jgi:hypothetical protein
MSEFSQPRGPMTPGERNFVVFFATVVLALMAAEIVHNYEPVKLSALMVLLFWVPLLALHEVGHALAAALLGWYVGRVVIGVGRLVARFRVGTALVEVRLLPVEGFVVPVPRNLRRPRLKSALIYFAGPGSELLLLAVVALALGPSTLLARTDHVGTLAAQSLCVAVLVSAVSNLVPHAVQVHGGSVANDGLGIIRSFLVPESHFAAQVGLTFDADTEEWKKE